MRVSYRWLGDFVDLDGLTPQEAASLLTMSGSKVESLLVIDLSAIVVGKVLEQRPHPSSRDPLWIHQVDLGAETRQIIAGAPNARAGTLVPVALPGTVVPSGKQVRDAKIAGEEGRGMMCSAAELLLGEDHSGIMLLAEGKPGQSLGELFPLDAVLDIEVTPNRPDCLGHMGIGRELAAVSGRPMKRDFMPPFIEGEDPPAVDLIKIAIEEPDLCTRFVAAPVTGLKVGPSPAWVQVRLRLAGVRPINNVVDATAYGMLEYGKPTHAFDLRRLRGDELRVRRARDGESLLCLDGQTRRLSPAMLVVADGEGPVAIGGVIGGQASAVQEDTTDVLIESAGWNGVNIRGTSRALGLRTEASARHEKGLAPELALAGARRVTALVREWAGGTVHREWIDLYPRPQEPIRVHVTPEKIDALLGAHVPLTESRAILDRLGFQTRVQDGGDWDVMVPVFRLDVAIPEDVVEEVGRIYGVDRIPPTLPGRRHESWTPAPTSRPQETIRQVLAGAGFAEAVTPALVSSALLEKLGLAGRMRRLLNPMSEELDAMRTSLLPSLLQVARLNQNRGRPQVRLFELARVYLARSQDPSGLADEPLTVAALAHTGGTPAAGREGFLLLKAVTDRLAHALSLPAPAYERATDALFHPGRTAAILLDGAQVGLLGELHPSLGADFDLDGRVVAVQLDLGSLLGAAKPRQVRPLPRFPAVQRDLAVVLPEDQPTAAVQTAIREVAGDLLEQVRAFDEYRSPELGAGVKSLAFALTFRSPERTLTDSEVDQLMDQTRRRLESEFGAKSR